MAPSQYLQTVVHYSPLQCAAYRVPARGPEIWRGPSPKQGWQSRQLPQGKVQMQRRQHRPSDGAQEAGQNIEMSYEARCCLGAARELGSTTADSSTYMTSCMQLYVMLMASMQRSKCNVTHSRNRK